MKINLQKIFLLIGMGKTNQAAARAIIKHGGCVIATDDDIVDLADEVKAEINREVNGEFEFHPQPTADKYLELSQRADYLLPTPGLPASHLIYGTKNHANFISELDIAGSLTNAPIVAITGTNGKSTVVSLVTDALINSGIPTVACGNLEVPFTKAVLENPDSQMFVVEASSFGLRHTKCFSPKIAAWLNFAPNHLNIHANLKDYENSKAKIWERITDEDVWVANQGDLVVWKNRPKKGKSHVFGEQAKTEVATAKFLNETAATLIAVAAGATNEAVLKSIQDFEGLPHRMQEITAIDGVSWFNDSKATTPHATKAGLSQFGNVVLIAGGRDKSGMISELNQLQNISALVAIGESAKELHSNFTGLCPVEIACDMKQAVSMAYEFSCQKDLRVEAVVLSPGAASFDWYASYEERGNDFANEVKELEKCK